MTNGIKLIIVGLGCFFGGLLRYATELLVGAHINPLFGDPLAVLIVNTVGCFIIGLFTAWVLKKVVSEAWNKFIITGFCGGLTTFSSFAQGMQGLFQAGQVWVAVIYIIANMILGLAAVYFGLYVVMGKSFTDYLVK